MAKGICAIIPSDTPNPAVDDPIPAYARAWDPNIRRPTHLPEDYDERIAPEYIFFLPAGPEETADGLTESGVYVVAKKCDHCERLRKACTRARPTCQMCHAGRHDCVTSDTSYVHLSGPKGTRPSRSKGGVPGQPVPRSTAHPRLRTLRLRSSTASRESLPPDSRSPSPTLSEELPRRAKTAPHENEGRRHDSPARGKANKKRKAKPADMPTASAGPSRPKKSKVEPSASGSRKASATRKRKRPAGRVSSANDKHDASPSWTAVQPAIQSTDSNHATLLEPYASPRIWASNKEELLEVLPTLKNEVNGVVWGNVEAPVLFLQGPVWPGDQWHGQKTIEVTMIRRRVQHQFPQQLLDAGPVNLPSAQGDDLTIDSSNPVLAIPVPAADPPTVRPQPCALHPSAQLDAPPLPSDEASAALVGPSNPSPAPALRSSPGLESLYHQTVPATSPHPAPLSLLCEASSMADNLSVAGELIKDHSSQHTTSVRGSPVRGAGRDTLNAPRSRSSSVSSGMSYDEARELSGSSYATTLTSVLSWKPDYFSPSPSDTRFRTSSVRDDPEGGDPATNTGDLKQSLFHLHATRWTKPLAPSSFPNSHFSHASHREDGPPAHDAQPNQPPASALSHPLQASDFGTMPPEFSALQEHHQIGLPVAVVLCRDSALWNFDLPPKYGCVFLGFFNIARMGYTHVDAERLRCRIRLEWTPGGDSADPIVEPPLTPWWIEPDGSGTDSHNVDSEMVLHPYSFLPLHILAMSAFTDKDRAIGVSEVTSVEGWHCQQCGKLNVQRNLRLQRCSDCARENGLPPIRVDCVRNPHLMAPSSWPWDKTCGNVVSAGKRLSDGSCTQTYTIDNRAIVKHIYTCNRPEVQRGSSRLFTAIQRDTELVQHKASGWLGAGSHYIAVFGDGVMYDIPCTPWTGTPSSIIDTRDVFQERCRAAGDWPSFVVDKMLVTAWMDAGSRKGCLVPAKGMRIAMYCLGADVELSISPKPIVGSEGKTRGITRIKADLDTWISLNDEAVDGSSRTRDQSVQIKDEDVETQPNLNLLVADDAEPLKPQPTSASSGVSGKRPPRNKEAPKEPLFVTLVHGDMLLFDGGDFEYTLKRTGMSVVLIATDTEQGV
ncbi:uncharacterized protein B0H18DRAFT_1004572 [Fomitopsis serialis]|uniref:uncharacterized protein n=1 Tax=Fomitopsis serialis TaxID=139415 RepID=UPI002008E44C|nr:uncharacterized protein B0H18DRAFT_1004572 [Neoantrodia serialis]KAH9926934.1 hypothetical protein B0H18DRAFT_1004572 [Neoantrodia serialis]